QVPEVASEPIPAPDDQDIEPTAAQLRQLVFGFLVERADASVDRGAHGPPTVGGPVECGKPAQDTLEPQTTSRTSLRLPPAPTARLPTVQSTGGRWESHLGGLKPNNLGLHATCPNGRRRRRNESLESPKRRFHNCRQLVFRNVSLALFLVPLFNVLPLTLVFGAESS